MWTREFHRQDNLHVNVWRYCMWFKGSKQMCENNSKTIQQYARRFLRGHWSFQGIGSEKKWYGIYNFKPDGSRDRIAEIMTLNFAETLHPVFRGTGERRFKKQRRRNEVCWLRWQHPKHWVASSSGHLRQSAQCFRIRSAHDWRNTRWSESSGETRCTRSTG